MTSAYQDWHDADVSDADAPAVDDWLLRPLADVRDNDTAFDADNWQLDRIEAKLDAILTIASSLGAAGEELRDKLADGGGGLFGALGAMLRG